ncbi:MAG: hypothetical protein ACYC3X_12915 [Pirellulaceae bacterium]
MGTGTLLGLLGEMQIVRLPPAALAKLIGALVLLTIGGLALIVLSWLALRTGRRYWNRSVERASHCVGPTLRDDWADKPLVAKPESRPDSDDA